MVALMDWLWIGPFVLFSVTAGAVAHALARSRWRAYFWSTVVVSLPGLLTVGQMAAAGRGWSPRLASSAGGFLLSTTMAVALAALGGIGGRACREWVESRRGRRGRGGPSARGHVGRA